jgi:hypothetical protein
MIGLIADNNLQLAGLQLERLNLARLFDSTRNAHHELEQDYKSEDVFGFAGSPFNGLNAHPQNTSLAWFQCRSSVVTSSFSNARG